MRTRNVIIVLACLCFFSRLRAEESTQVERLLIESRNLIDSSARLFNIRPRLMASIIYAERSLNVSWMEDELDLLLAQSGYSSSIGLGQIKIHTAQWIEKKLADSKSKYFLGASFVALLPASNSKDGVIGRLRNPMWNSKYVAAYISMFCHRWKQAGFDISSEPAIIATLYSLGPYHAFDQSERVPHSQAKSNQLGQIAEHYYKSDRLLDIFPR